MLSYAEWLIEAPPEAFIRYSRNIPLKIIWSRLPPLQLPPTNSYCERPLTLTRKWAVLTGIPTANRQIYSMERPEIVELFYSALTSLNDLEQFLGFLLPRVEWILAAADPQTLGEELPSNAIKFSGTEGFRQLALYFRDNLKRDLWRPYRVYSASPSRIFVWKSAIANPWNG